MSNSAPIARKLVEENCNAISAEPIPLLLSAPQVAAQLGFSVRTIWRLESAGKLPRPIRLGRSVRWRRDEIVRWILAYCPEQRSPKNGEKRFHLQTAERPS